MLAKIWGIFMMIWCAFWFTFDVYQYAQKGGAVFLSGIIIQAVCFAFFVFYTIYIFTQEY